MPDHAPRSWFANGRQATRARAGLRRLAVKARSRWWRCVTWAASAYASATCGTLAAAEAEAPVPSATHLESATTIDLFNGRDLEGWTTLDGGPVGDGWSVVDGALRLRSQAGGQSIVTRAEFDDFRLEFQWRIAPGVNNGVKYHVRDYGRGIRGFEYQILDDSRHPYLRGTRWSLGALYDLYEPSPVKEARPPGVYNESVIVMQFPHIEHWLNGTRILTATIGSDAWFARYAASKFVEHPGFGGFGRGRIMLTDHGGETWYRSVRLTPLPAQPSAAFALKLGGAP